MQLGSQSTPWPSQLYKYRALDAGCLKVITDNTLYFSSPSGFNDPFDSNASHLLQHVDLAHLAQELAREFDRQAAERDLYINRSLDDQSDGFKRAGWKPYSPAPGDDTLWAENDLFRRFFAEVTSGIHRTDVAKEGYRILSDLVDRGYGICSLAAVPDSVLMWSHYADQHRGLALEFDSTRRLFRKTLGISAHEVVYANTPSSASANVGLESRFLRLFTTKHTDWRYEHEFRYISHRGPGIRFLKSCTLKRVILGCRFEENPDTQKELVFDAIRARNEHRPKGAQIRIATAFQRRGKLAIGIKENLPLSLAVRSTGSVVDPTSTAESSPP